MAAGAQSWGTVVTWDSSFFAQITSVSWSGIERASIETTYLGTTTAKTFTPDDLYDAGAIDVELFFDPTLSPSIDATGVATVTVDWSGIGTGNIWSNAAAFMTNFQAGASMGELMTASATLKASGAFTIA
jgi:uncharacterized protein RhaS with RHS repeats